MVIITNKDSVLKSKDITLPTKVCIVKAMVSPVVMYGCESWTIKKAEGWRIDAFKLWYWSRLLGVPLDYKEIKPVNPKENKSWIFIGRNNGEVESPSLTTWCTERIHWKRPWCWETLRQEEKGATEDDWMASPTQQTWAWANSER